MTEIKIRFAQLQNHFNEANMKQINKFGNSPVTVIYVHYTFMPVFQTKGGEK